MKENLTATSYGIQLSVFKPFNGMIRHVAFDRLVCVLSFPKVLTAAVLGQALL